MDFSQQITEQIHRGFFSRACEIPYIQDTILPQIVQVGSTQRRILEFYYMGMPLADLAGVPFETLLSYATFAAAQLQQAAAIPQEIFLNYLAQYRINTEDITFIRPQLQQAILPLLAGLSTQEAVLEVNRWCACHMTYRLTDQRTASPATSLRSGYGRCGEESTLLVEALRSVGIPARQVYTPKWAHCDDNHAWVEAWCEGRWHFLGACEPEPVLDKGWFNAAASRAMLVHTKAFGNITEEEILSQEGTLTLLNQTRRYAPCKQISICVYHNTQPVAGVKLYLQLVNMAEAAEIATLTTDAAGKANITLGLGSILIRALHPKGRAELQIDTALEEQALLHLHPHQQLQTGMQQLSMRAPSISDQTAVVLSEQQAAAHKATLAYCDSQRAAYTAGFYQADAAEQFAPSIRALLQAAEGNFDELYQFLTTPLTKEEEALKSPLLSTLTAKDYRDARCDVLLSHLKAAAAYRGEYPDEIFIPYLLSPRISDEPLTDYRGGLLSHLCPCDMTAYIYEPPALWQRVMEQIKILPHDDNLIPAAPLAVAYSGLGTDRSAAVLAVAWCRSLGIPARLDPVTGRAQYYRGDGFIDLLQASANPDAQLDLYSEGTSWRYHQNWSLSALKDGRYHPLSLADQQWTEDHLSLPLYSGCYRLIATNRLPNGNQHLHVYDFTLTPAKPHSIHLQLPAANISDLLSAIPLSSFAIGTSQGQTAQISDLLPQTGVIIWLETSREPSEHILNELLLNSEELNRIGCPICLLLKEPKAADYPLIQILKTRLHHCNLLTADFTQASQLARRMFTDPDKLPLTIVVDQGLTGVYASAGYNVGEGALILKILQTFNKK